MGKLRQHVHFYIYIAVTRLSYVYINRFNCRTTTQTRNYVGGLEAQICGNTISWIAQLTRSCTDPSTDTRTLGTWVYLFYLWSREQLQYISL